MTYKQHGGPSASEAKLSNRLHFQQYIAATFFLTLWYDCHESCILFFWEPHLVRCIPLTIDAMKSASTTYGEALIETSPRLSWKTWGRLIIPVHSRTENDRDHILNTLFKPTRSYARLYSTPGILHEPQPGCSTKSVPRSLQSVQVLECFRLFRWFWHNDSGSSIGIFPCLCV